MSNESEQVGDLRLGTVVINVEDMERAVEFWPAALGYEKRDAAWDPAFMTLIDSAPDRTAHLAPADRPQAGGAGSDSSGPVYVGADAARRANSCVSARRRRKTGTIHQIRTSSCSGILTATSSASSTSPPIEDCRPTVDCSPRLLGT